MLCKNPFIRDPSGKVFHCSNREEWYKGIPFPCGQCLPCRINRRRVWSTRLFLESVSHKVNLPMLTLTYDNDNLPFTLDGQPTLCKRDLQLYFKRLRSQGYKFRYYACGEYGERTNRPHYHLMVFGVDPLFVSDFVSTWPYGLVHKGYDSSFEAVQYVAGYVTKKITVCDKSDVRQREFALMSRKPAIGSFALSVIADTYARYPELVTTTLSNPSLRINGKFSPLGRTLASKLKSILGADDSADSFVFEMRRLALDKARTYDPMSDSFYDGPLVQFLLSESRQRNLQIESHSKIWRRSKV